MRDRTPPAGYGNDLSIWHASCSCPVKQDDDKLDISVVIHNIATAKVTATAKTATTSTAMAVQATWVVVTAAEINATCDKIVSSRTDTQREEEKDRLLRRGVLRQEIKERQREAGGWMKRSTNRSKKLEVTIAQRRAQLARPGSGPLMEVAANTDQIV